ncbi:MAG: hypothetical protein IE925_06450 [Rhodobacterales bacterium]|nr:hypothetical protein [Rhodobacterales bacterium]
MTKPDVKRDPRSRFVFGGVMGVVMTALYLVDNYFLSLPISSELKSAIFVGIGSLAGILTARRFFPDKSIPVEDFE